MNRAERFLALVEQAAPTSRRQFLKRSVAMGVSLPIFGSLLSACGGDDDDDSGDSGEGSGDSEPTATGRGQVPGPDTGTEEPEGDATAGGTEAEGSATEAEATGTEAEGGATETEAEGSGGGAEGEPKQGGTLLLMGHEAVDGLSPDYTGPTVNWSVITQMHNAMVEMDPWYEYQPTLAESFEVSEDASQYTFTLRQGVLFHDGEEFTSEDVKYTFEYYGNVENAAVTGSDFVSVDTVEAPDDYTVVINLKYANAAFFAQAGSYLIVPAHVHGEIGEDEYARAPIGTGAFKLANYVADSTVELEAFPDHFRGAPHLAGIKMSNVPEPSVRAIALETGEADSSVWSLNTEDILRLRDMTDQFSILVSQSTAVNNMPMDNSCDQFKEKAVRQALMYAIDRQSIVDDLWSGLAVRAETNFSPALAYWFDDSEVKKYDYDPEMAKQILDEAGWVPGDDGIRAKDGVKLSWTTAIIAGDQARRPIAEAVQQWVSEIGCHFEIVESTAMSETLRDHENQMGLHNWTYGGSGGDPDATSVLHSDFSDQRIHYKSEEMDALLEAGLAEPDPEKRKAIYKDVQKLFCEDVPILYIQYWDWYTFYRSRVKGLPQDVLSATQSYNMAHTFWIDEESA